MSEDSFVLSEDQVVVKSAMENSNDDLWIWGPGGSGKSFIVNKCKESTDVVLNGFDQLHESSTWVAKPQGWRVVITSNCPPLDTTGFKIIYCAQTVRSH